MTETAKFKGNVFLTKEQLTALIPDTGKLYNVRGSAFVIETFKDGYSFYRLWSDGWLEQGGYLSRATPSVNDFAITFYLPYLTVPAYISKQGLNYNSTNGVSWSHMTIRDITSTGFVVNRNDVVDHNWYACGQAALKEK